MASVELKRLSKMLINIFIVDVEIVCEVAEHSVEAEDMMEL